MTQPFQKIVIRTPNWLGDLMMSTAFIQAVLDQFPEAQVDLIVKSGFEGLPLPHRGQIKAFDKTKQSAGSFGRGLQAESYDCFYVLPPSTSSAWMAFRSRAASRIGYVGSGRKWMLKPAIAYQQVPRSQHLVDEYLGLLSEKKKSRYMPTLALSEAWVAQQLEALSALPESFIALATGANYGPAKKWPIAHYRQLASMLQEQGHTVLLVGTPDDVEDGDTIAEGLGSVQNWCGKTNLSQLLALLSKAQLLVSNDSGAMHIMTALQRPQIAVFGSTDPTWTSPLNDKAELLHQKIDCSPCFSRTCRFGHYQCLTQIAPEQVLRQVLEMQKGLPS